MFPTLALVSSLVAATADPVAIHLSRGQELVYRGRFTDESENSAADRRARDFEARAYVMDVGPAGAEVAFLTVLRTPGSATDPVISARLALGNVDARGRVTMLDTGASPRLPLDGPPTLEPAGFIELSPGAVTTWDVGDGQRPPREWQIVGDDFQPGCRCVKLIGVQQSAAWGHPVDDVPAWRRTDTVWLSPATGLVQRLERTIELRNPDGSARGASRIEYERVENSGLQTTINQRREIAQCVECERKLTGLFSQTERARRPEQFAALMARIDNVSAGQPPTAYRAALLAIRRRAEAAGRGEVPPPTDAPDPPPAPPTVGRSAADFITAELTSGASMRLARWRGQSAVLLFVRPDSTAAGQTLRLAADLQSRFGDRLHVAVLVISDEDRARPAWATFGVRLFAGREAAELYGVTTPSRVFIIDADGIVRYIGDAGPGVIDAVQRLLAR